MSFALTRNWSLALFSGMLLLGPIHHCSAGEFWEEKPASEWTFEEALKLVTDSPWAHEQTLAWMRSIPPGERPARWQDPYEVQIGRPPQTRQSPPPLPGSSTGRDILGYDVITAGYLVRWESAPVVQRAFTRLEELGERATAHFQAPTPRLPQDGYVVTVKTTRPPDPYPDIFLGLSDEELCERSQLKAAGLTVRPLEVERSGVGAAAAVHFFFPRVHNHKPILQPGLQKVEFSFRSKNGELRSRFTVAP